MICFDFVSIDPLWTVPDSSLSDLSKHDHSETVSFGKQNPG